MFKDFEHRIPGGKDAMRADCAKVVRQLLSAVNSVPWLAAGLGGTCGVVGVAILTQFFVTFGTSIGVRLGLVAATLSGVAWGVRQARGTHSMTAAAQLLWLAVILLLWPAWSGLQLDLAAALPPSVWTWPYCAEVCGIAFGLLSWTVPMAVITQLLMISATPFRTLSADQDPKFAVSLGAAVGIGVLTLGVAPDWGVFWPALSLILLASLGVAIAEHRGVALAWTPPATQSSRRVHWIWLALCGLAGFQGHAGMGLISEIAPASLAMWQLNVAVILLGWSLGLWWNSGSRASDPPHSTPGSALATLSLLTVGLLQLTISAGLIDMGLWLSSRIVVPLLLEAARMALAMLLLGPLGFWCGWLTSRQLELGRGVVGAVLAGLLVGELVTTFAADAVPRLWVIVTVLGLTGIATAIRERGVWTSRYRYGMGGVGVLFALCVALVPTSWPIARAVKLSFSTPALLAARGDWPTELLTELDDARLITTTAGTEGVWTLWKSRDADLHVRLQGIPRGAITARPDWSPQYAPDVACMVWPLVLVDQPARVLVLGAGNSASLQAALAFPLRELVCCEPDDALTGLIQGEVATRTGFDPFSDERCRRLRQPVSWLALPAVEQYDVIVSNPPTVVAPAASASMSVAFFQRAARHLSPTGVFCQRLTSVDFGPRPLLGVAATMQQAFAETVCLEVGPGEYLLLGAHDPAALVRQDLPERLEWPHVSHVLSRCNWDWSLPLNFPAYDRAALAEAASEIQARPQTTTDPWLPHFAPRELLRWAPKLQETAALLAKKRASAAAYPLAAAGQPPRTLSGGVSRKGRYLEWIGPNAEDPVVLRRLAEAMSQQQLVLQYPDAYWWEYRKELREQLQDRPRTAIRMVNYTNSQDTSRWHPEDRRRKEYFQVLGAALKAERPSLEQLADVGRHLEPYDPLLTLFAHQELAELHARNNENPAVESIHRLHVIYYAPAGDASVRNVVAAIDHLVDHADAAASDAERFDQLNGLLQTLRTRWENRNGRPPKSARVAQQEIERSLVSVERAIETMDSLALAAGWSPDEWSRRQQVLERMLVRPFRSYRDQLVVHARESERKTRELLDRATNIQE